MEMNNRNGKKEKKKKEKRQEKKERKKETGRSNLIQAVWSISQRAGIENCHSILETAFRQSLLERLKGRTLFFGW